MGQFGFSNTYILLIKSCLKKKVFCIGQWIMVSLLYKAQEDFVRVWNPRLFIISEEALSRGLSSLFQKELLGFNNCGRSSIFITHLLYYMRTRLLFSARVQRDLSRTYLAFFTSMKLHQVSALTSLRVLCFSQGKLLRLGRL